MDLGYLAVQPTDVTASFTRELGSRARGDQAVAYTGTFTLRRHRFIPRFRIDDPRGAYSSMGYRPHSIGTAKLMAALRTEGT